MAQHDFLNTAMANIVTPAAGKSSFFFDWSWVPKYKTAAGLVKSFPEAVDHDSLLWLDYASSGHTGFVPDTRVINGEDLSADIVFTTDDIWDSVDKRYVTDDDLTNLWNLDWTNTWDQAASDFDHNDLSNMDWGTPGEYYHLTQAEYNNIMPVVYGEMYLNNETWVTMTLTNDDTYYGITAFTEWENVWSSFENNIDGDRLVIDTNGDWDYEINFKIDCSTDPRRQVYIIAIFKNWVEQTKLRTYLKANETPNRQYVNWSISWVLAGLVATDYLDVRVQNIQANWADFDIYNANLFIKRLST